MSESWKARPISLTLEQQDKFWAKVQKTEGCWIWNGPHSSRGYGRFQVGGRTYNAHRVAYALTLGDPAPELDVDHLCRNVGCCNPSHLESVSHQENVRRGNGFGGRNIRRTHCARGHEFTPENTELDKRGFRVCIACKEDKRELQRVYCKTYRATEKGRERSRRQTAAVQIATRERFATENPGVPYSRGAAISAATPKGSARAGVRLTEVLVLEIRQKYESGACSQSQLAKMYGVGKSTIDAALNRRTWKHI